MRLELWVQRWASVDVDTTAETRALKLPTAQGHDGRSTARLMRPWRVGASASSPGLACLK